MARKKYLFYLSEKEGYPLIELEKDAWNDYGYTTLYSATLCIASFNCIPLGQVKILNVTVTNGVHTFNTRLPDTFYELPSNYISLGQDMAYYKTLGDLDRTIYERIFRGLNDVVYRKNLAAPYREHPGFTNSLLRFSEAEKAYKEAGQYFHRESVTDDDLTAGKKYNFTFRCRLKNASLDHVAEFDFDSHSPLPGRINALIGKNGTGKTQFLAKFANTISGLKDPEEGTGIFEPDRPAFCKIIAISYSAFDSFKKPPRKPLLKDRTFSYQYCGLQDNTGLLSIPDVKKFNELLTLINEKNRFVQWKTIMDALFQDNDFQLQDNDFQLHKNDSNFGFELLRSYSSGQAIVFYIITHIIAHIEEESLLLFDEPEMHLHPNLLSNLMRVFYRLLEAFNSYSIIATHSPLILQEIPSRYVRVFKRLENVPLVQKLEKECFGENLSTITEEVFQVDEVPSSYRSILENLSDSHTYDEVLQIFDGKLSLNAKIYLKNIYSI